MPLRQIIYLSEGEMQQQDEAALLKMQLTTEADLSKTQLK